MVFMFQDFAKVEKLITPVINALLDNDGKRGLCIVVLIGDKKASTEKALVWTHRVNDYGKAESIALAKAKTSWRTGHSTRAVSESAWLLAEKGDCLWPGAIVHDDHDIRVVVAVSGLTPRHDEYLALMTVNTIDLVSDDNAKGNMDGNGMVE